MGKSKKTKPFEKILSHPEVSLIRQTPNGFIVKVVNQHWRISQTMHTKLLDNLAATDEIFFGDPKWFYNRFVVMSYTAEENSSKKWTQQEDDILEDMIDDDFTIGDISAELKRDITAIAIRGAKYADVDSKPLLSIEREELHSLRFSDVDI